MVFEEGVPQKITVHTFRTHFGANFPQLLQEANTQIVEDAIASVYTMFAGVGDMWKHLSTNIWYEKTRLCYGLLTAWYIADVYPSYAVGVQSTGGIPVKSKQIGGVKIMFDTAAYSTEDILNALRSNVFGSKAYQMLKSSGSLLKIFGRTR